MNIPASALPAISGVQLDPFSYFPNVASRFCGLGGPDERPELSYGFHTQYIHCAPGHCHFHLKIDGLEASSGLLYMQVHMLSTRPGSQAGIATVERLPLVDLVTAGGEASVRFESIKDMIYAVYGRVVEATDARASGLTVTLDRPGSENQDASAAIQATSLGLSASRGVERLVSSDPPSLAKPSSQVCTLEQFSEPAFMHWCEALGEQPRLSAELWQSAFLLQALDRYGFLQTGARMLGLGGFATAAPAFLAKRGVELLLGYHSPIDETLLEWRDRHHRMIQRDRLTSAETIARQISIEPVYVPAPHANLGQFDALWSIGILDHMQASHIRREFVLNSLERVEPRGLAIHLFSLTAPLRPNLVDKSEHKQVDQRHQIESLALNIISLGHDVAQLRFNMNEIYADDSGQSAFGLIVRRSLAG